MRKIAYRALVRGTNGEPARYTRFVYKGVFLAWGIEDGKTKAIIELPGGFVAMFGIGHFKFIGKKEQR